MHQSFVAICKKINKTIVIFFPGTFDSCNKNLFCIRMAQNSPPNSPPNTPWGYNMRDDKVSVACEKKVWLFFCLFVAMCLKKRQQL